MSENSAITGHIRAAAGNGAGKLPWRDLVPPRVEEIAMRGNGYVLAASGGIAVCAGALLPFMWHAQASAGLGPAQVSWYPSIGLLLSVAGCAACTAAAIVMRRTRPEADRDNA